MTQTGDTMTAAMLELMTARRGHFQLESGHHGALWLDLDGLFADSRRIAPFVERLAGTLRPYEPSIVCGPLLGGAFLAQLVAQTLGVGFCFTERVMPSGNAGLYRARYRLPPAFADRVRGQRTAIVDDVLSAGSALHGTCVELDAHAAIPVVAGALLMLGTAGADRLAEHGVPVESVARQAFDMWPPASCPLCAAGSPLEQP
ncbi:MAG: phosphoribosyltransferase family protein [Vicinamibacterales bacterium]